MQDYYVAVTLLRNNENIITPHLLRAAGIAIVATDYKRLYKLLDKLAHVYKVDLENEQLVLQIVSEWLEAKFDVKTHKILKMPRLWGEVKHAIELEEEKNV